MSTLNRYVLNRAHPEGSMIKAYTTEEAVNCYTRYIKDGRAIGLPVHPHGGKTSGMGCTGWKVRTNIPNAMIQEAHDNICHHYNIRNIQIQRSYYYTTTPTSRCNIVTIRYATSSRYNARNIILLQQQLLHYSNYYYYYYYYYTTTTTTLLQLLHYYYTSSILQHYITTTTTTLHYYYYYNTLEMYYLLKKQ
jgi:hypothetical protein